MSEFEAYFKLGKKYILDFSSGYVLILFAVALCTIYLMRDWRKILILLTAFILGHAISIALVALGWFPFKPALLEFLIPFIIFSTAVTNIFRTTEPSDRTTYVNFGITFFFALVQGLYFYQYLTSMLGRDRNIVPQLFGFLVGLELGQLIIIIVFMVVSFLLVDLFTVNRRDWKLVISSALAGMALLLMKDKIFW